MPTVNIAVEVKRGAAPQEIEELVKKAALTAGLAAKVTSEGIAYGDGAIESQVRWYLGGARNSCVSDHTIQVVDILSDLRD